MSTKQLSVTDPDLLTLHEIRQRLPGRPAPNRIRQWITRGCNGTKLAAVRLGGTWYTTLEAVQQFSKVLSEPYQSQPVCVESDAWAAIREQHGV